MPGPKVWIGFVASVGLNGLLVGGGLRVLAELYRPVASIDPATLGLSVVVLVLFSPLWFVVGRFWYRLVVGRYRAIAGRPLRVRAPRPSRFELAVVAAAVPTGIVIALLLPGAVAGLLALVAASVLSRALRAVAVPLD